MAHTAVFDQRIFVLAEDARELRDERLAGWFSRLAGGDLAALEPIYDACAAEIFAIAHWRTGSRADAADCVQEVFVKLASSPGRLAEVRHARRYLLTMAHRAAIDRGRRRPPASPLDHSALLTAPSLDPDRTVDAERATAVLRTLPAAQREAIYLHHFADLPFREIGRVTGVPTFTAASRYRLGLARLRARLGGTR